MRFDSRRADCPGYLEFVWIKKSLPEGAHPQAIALITDGDDGRFHGMYGLHTVVASTVSACKAELFALIEAGQ